MGKYWPAIERLCASVSQRLRLSKESANSTVYEKLISSCSLVFVATGSDEGTAKSQELLRRHLWDRPSNPQAQLCNEMMRTLQGSDLNAVDEEVPGTDPCV